jgi:hypothetical protein
MSGKPDGASLAGSTVPDEHLSRQLFHQPFHLQA